VRTHLQEVLSKDRKYKGLFEENKALQEKLLVALKDVKYHLPMQIGDFTDFYAGKNHAYNVSSPP